MICNGNPKCCNDMCSRECQSGCSLCGQSFNFTVFGGIVGYSTNQEVVCWSLTNSRIVLHKECAKEFSEKLVTELAVDSIEKKGW